jgi:hypothetical protein
VVEVESQVEALGLTTRVVAKAVSGAPMISSVTAVAARRKNLSNFITIPFENLKNFIRRPQKSQNNCLNSTKNMLKLDLIVRDNGLCYNGYCVELIGCFSILSEAFMVQSTVNLCCIY